MSSILKLESKKNEVLWNAEKLLQISCAMQEIQMNFGQVIESIEEECLAGDIIRCQEMAHIKAKEIDQFIVFCT